MHFLKIERAITGIKSEIIFRAFGIPFSNSTLLIMLIAAILLLIYFFSIRKFSFKPGKFQTAAELTYESIISLVNQITESTYHSKKIMPLIGALLVYIGISNLISTVLPGLTSITWNGASIFRTPTADFNTTFGLAFGSIAITHIASIVDWGILGHFSKFFQFKEIYLGFKKSFSDGAIALIGFFVGLLDIVGEIAKVISLSLRLFGNMYAGEVLTIVLFGAMAYALPSLWMVMGLLSAVVQAIVFGSLVAVYYTLSVKPEKENKQ